ncbi:hypothetical protein Clacol_007423 [Clathrus columnatus]|uniref:25S rRNA (uridine-N(3))-methyltransferase BMT5-like domain-containing protein n=1 Tax=Clathrus columnatus TaxID=1419009 RepID=A0AAV5AEW9_9AGAM|nr:hypothetical protein Clacol_007423 [Clathrus columnatus]
MAKSKKPSLKASFSKFQEKKYRDHLEKSREAVRVEQLKKNKAGNSSIKSKGKQRASSLPAGVVPFSPTDTILLIGEGNFSFTRALFISNHPQLQHLPPQNVTATAYDSEETCYAKYPDARDMVKDLRDKGVNIVFGVDATALHLRKEFKGHRWKRIVWNFPHAGKGIADQDRNILSNQILILNFLRCAADFLETGDIPSFKSHSKRSSTSDNSMEDVNEETNNISNQDYQTKERGTILLTLKNVSPYTLCSDQIFGKDIRIKFNKLTGSSPTGHRGVLASITLTSPASHALLHGSPEAKKAGEAEILQHSRKVARGKYVHSFEMHRVRPDAADSYKKAAEKYYTGLIANPDLKVKLTGGWETLIGEQDTFLHVLEYENYGGFDKVLGLVKGSEHEAAYKDMLPYITHRTSQLNQEFAFFPSSPPSCKGGIFELRTYQLAPGKLLEWEAAWRKGIEARRELMAPVGAWFSQVGRLHQVHHMWQYSDTKTRKEIREKAWQRNGWSETVSKTAQLATIMDASILLPLPYSTLK